jgi:putative sigma-54 modulation protein
MKKTREPKDAIEVHVKGKNLTITPALHDQVVHKMGRLDKYLDRLQGIEVELRTEQTRDSADHNCVEATTRVAGRQIRVIAKDGDMYAAIDEAVDKLYRQLNRHKERLKSHHSNKFIDVMPSDAVVEQDEAGDEGPTSANLPEGPLIRVQTLDMKPQFEDEAVLELEDGGREFYVFLNARNEQVNVLYRHSDGGYGLIEPHVR